MTTNLVNRALGIASLALVFGGCERKDSRQEQAEERQENQTRAAEDLRDETRDLQEEHADVARQSAEVNRLLTRACEGLETARQMECPIDQSWVQQVSDIDNGVKLQLALGASSENDVERRVDCYVAHKTLHSTQAGIGPAQPGNAPVRPAEPLRPARPLRPGERPAVGTTPGTVPGTVPGAMASAGCILDVPGVETDVDDHDGRVDIEVTTNNDAEVPMLRQRAQFLVQHQAMAEPARPAPARPLVPGEPHRGRVGTRVR